MLKKHNHNMCTSELKPPMTNWAQRLSPAAILSVGLALRLLEIDFGLLNLYCKPDETTLVHRH